MQSQTPMLSRKSYPVPVRMPQKLVKALDAEAKRQRRSRGAMAVIVLAQGLKVKL